MKTSKIRDSDQKLVKNILVEKFCSKLGGGKNFGPLDIFQNIVSRKISVDFRTQIKLFGVEVLSNQADVLPIRKILKNFASNVSSQIFPSFPRTDFGNFSRNDFGNYLRNYFGNFSRRDFRNFTASDLGNYPKSLSKNFDEAKISDAIKKFRCSPYKLRRTILTPCSGGGQNLSTKN